ncbi:MAG: formate dehydrogenase [Burkholderiales bacterium]
MKNPQSRLSRRGFLFAMGASGAAATAALVTPSGRETRPDTERKIAESKGYRLTEHVQNYYRTAKI